VPVSRGPSPRKGRLPDETEVDESGNGESEEIVGKVLKVAAMASLWTGSSTAGDDPNRQGSSRRWIMRAIEDSLRRLDTDWIDLDQVGRMSSSMRRTRMG